MGSERFVGIVTDTGGRRIVLQERRDAARRYLELPSAGSKDELVESLGLDRPIAEDQPQRAWSSPPHHPAPSSAQPLWHTTASHERWTSVADALEAYAKGEALVEARALSVLRHLSSEPNDLAATMGELMDGLHEIHTFEERAGIRQLPLETPTLPPAAHTNTYLVGDERLIAVDPATFDPTERAKLRSAIDALIASGATFDSVVLTHHHPDHVGAASWLAEDLGVPIRAHAVTRSLLDGQIAISEELDEGDVIDLGVDRAGKPFVLDVWFTPGHAPGHVVLVDRRDDPPSMIAGDMIAAVGTIIIDPPEGDMLLYIQQLERMLHQRPSVLYPAHGPAITDGIAKLEHYIAHRNQREGKVLFALAELGPSAPEGLLPIAYDDTPEVLYPLATRSCLAHLLKLCAEGRVSESEGRYRLDKNES